MLELWILAVIAFFGCGLFDLLEGDWRLTVVSGFLLAVIWIVAEIHSAKNRCRKEGKHE